MAIATGIKKNWVARIRGSFSSKAPSEREYKSMAKNVNRISFKMIMYAAKMKDALHIGDTKMRL